LEDFWRTNDHTHAGMLSLSQLQRGLLKAHTSLQKGDLMRLLQITDMSSQAAVDGGFVTGNTEDPGGQGGQEQDVVKVDYRELLRRIFSMEKQERGSTIKQRLAGRGAKGGEGRHREEEGEDYHVSEMAKSATFVLGVGSEEGPEEGILGDDMATLGPIIEESLLELLTSLGALHSPEHQVSLSLSLSLSLCVCLSVCVFFSYSLAVSPSPSLPLAHLHSLLSVTLTPTFTLFFLSLSLPQVVLLPSENHHFRELIRLNFVEGSGGEDAWHGHMIRYIRSLSRLPLCHSLSLSLSLSFCMAISLPIFLSLILSPSKITSLPQIFSTGTQQFYASLRRAPLAPSAMSEVGRTEGYPSRSQDLRYDVYQVRTLLLFFFRSLSLSLSLPLTLFTIQL
jgi:hypothetical protein